MVLTSDYKQADYDKLNCNQLFDAMTQKQAQQMDEESFSDLITKVLQLKGDDPLQLYILTHCMKVDKAGHIPLDKLQNFFDYCKYLSKYQRAKKVKDLKKKIPEIRKQIEKPNMFKQMYKTVYSIFLIGSTTLDIDYALALWSVLLNGRLNYLKQLAQYVEELGQKKPKKIHKDLWNMMLQFSTVVKDLSKDYSQNDAWPVFIDNFVEWMKQKGL